MVATDCCHGYQINVVYDYNTTYDSKLGKFALSLGLDSLLLQT
jgi:hypothetical protein